MWTIRRIKLLLAIVVALFAASSAYISTLVVKRQHALEQASRYNTAWLASQGATEYARLEQRLSAFGNHENDVTADEVQLRFDIVVNRVRLFEASIVLEFLDNNPDQKATVHELSGVITRGQHLIDNIGQPGNATKLLHLLAPLDARMVQLAAAANRWGADRVAEDQHELISLHWKFSALAAGLILIGIILITLLLRHNRMLATAQQDLSDLAEDLGTQNGRFDAALTNMSQGLCMVDAEQRLIVCNQRFCELFGLAPSLVIAGTAIRSLSRQSSSDVNDEALSAIIAEQQGLIDHGTSGAFFYDMMNGQTLSVSHQPTQEGGWVATYEDVSERRRAEARIAHMAHHDALTDLPNRVLISEHIEHAFARSRRFGETFTLLSLDLDRFKAVNDTLGHSVGDALLKAIADRLRSCVRETDVVARMGGDEFAILQIGSEEERTADNLAERVIKLVGAPFDLDGHYVVIDTSIGIAVAPHDGENADQLLKNADLALYSAKADGRGTHRFFESGMDAAQQSRRLIELDLREALAAEEFEVYYQPLVNLASSKVIGYEALIRWHHPKRGFVSPIEFIDVAEDIGLIVPIGEWVLRQACMFAANWEEPLKIAVNLSPLQLKNPNLTQTVALALEESGLAATRLELEITENVFLQDTELTLSTLHELRRLGVRIAMDDFGTGYSSLSYLRSFPFDKIKLDKSFVDDIADRVDSVAIVRSIAMLGASLGMTTTAEGIETAEQQRLLLHAGFVEGQGYLFGRPQPVADIGRRPLSNAVRAA